MAEHVYRKEMGITHAEFFRLIEVAFDTDLYEAHSRGASMSDGGRTVDIELGQEGVRQIAMLSVPRTPVQLTLTGYSDAEADAFVARFDRAYQRGGG